MKMQVQIDIGFKNDIIGTDVKMGDKVVGKVIEYDKETGKAVIKITETETEWKLIAGETIGLTSRKNENSN